MSKIIPDNQAKVAAKAGRLRDYQIAELKGINPIYACYVDNFAGDEYCVLNEDKPFDCRICEREKIIDKFKCKEWKLRPENEWLPQWSTSHNDAWELWDELPVPKEYFVDKNKTVISIYDLNLAVRGDSFPDAVSKVWIEWKQQK